MRIVVQRTGLTPDLLRAWERRYGVVSPVRSPGGQRFYSSADVERLSLLARGTAYGRSIGQLARLAPDELQRLVAEDAVAGLPLTGRAGVVPPPLAERDLAAALEAVSKFDAVSLEGLLRTAALRRGADETLDGLIAPLLIRIGELWHEGRLRPANEHLASAVISRTLSWMMEIATPDPLAPSLVVATTVGQEHELGAMLAAVAATSVGWRVVYLGANLPASDIALAAAQTRAVAVALSVVLPVDDPGLRAELMALRAALPSHVKILVGGAAASNYGNLWRDAGAEELPSLDALRSWLGERGYMRGPRSMS
jgi:DNA-binding transcriptional MerR regulator/methylmalonyl-CoA mutase cobalamin-binding subunit